MLTLAMKKGHWVAAVCVVSTAALSTSAAAAQTWTRGAGVVTVTVDANFTVGFMVEGGWGLQNGGVSELIGCMPRNDRMCRQCEMHSCKPYSLLLARSHLSIHRKNSVS